LEQAAFVLATRLELAEEEVLHNGNAVRVETKAIKTNITSALCDKNSLQNGHFIQREVR
jgi:hypothetical protein